MGSDRSRISYDANQQYRAVVAQQGRVSLEADWNEAQQIASEELREEVLDFVGSSGTPDNGYKIKLINQSPDFNVSAGTMYVGGVRAFLSASIHYSQQLDWLDRVGDPDWRKPEQPKNGNLQSELVYLYLREQEVSTVEDSALQEVALGGPDTTQRTRLIQHIVRLPIQGTTCQTALEEAIDYWKNQGLNFHPQTMRLESSAKLKVSFSPSLDADDPCKPETRSGYLGAENQLIRVQISGFDQATGQVKLIWGFDNASFLYRVDIVNIQNQPILKLQSAPVDDFHRPRVGQAVEVLRSSAQLSNGEYIASATGVVYTLTNSATYNPDSQKITLPQSLPDEYQDVNQTPRVFVRIWEEEKLFTPGTAVDLGKTGLQVTLQTSDDQPFHVGDYWLFAVRPTTPEQIYPQRYLNFQPPDGPRLWVSTLAVINWATEDLCVEDCRQHFESLVSLTKRQAGGCCTVIVRPEDLKDCITLQSIIDRSVIEQFSHGDRVKICLMPGTYKLPRPLQLEQQHSNLTIEGCHDGAELQAQPGREREFLHGLIVLNRANNITIRNLRFQLPIVHFLEAHSQLQVLSKLLGEKFPKNLRISIGIRSLHSALLTVQNCLFRFAVEDTVNLFAVGIFASSECWGLKLLENRFLRDEEYLLLEQKTNQNEQRFLVGYLLAPNLIPTKKDNQFSIVPSLLQDAIIRDNRFTGLTTAILILADTGLARIENNTVIQCLFGFWLTAIELRAEFMDNIGLVVFLLGIFFPLPLFFDVSDLAQKELEIDSSSLSIFFRKFTSDIEKIQGIERLLLSLHVLGNDIDTGITEESIALSGPGLVIGGKKRLNRENNSLINTILLTANKIRRGKVSISGSIMAREIKPQLELNLESAQFAPASAMLRNSTSGNINPLNYTALIYNLDYITVTGNIIINENSTPPGTANPAPGTSTNALTVYSLIVIMSNSPPLAIAITGNVFRGIPFLPDDFNWQPLNTVTY